jgi:hypothetical protein
MLSLGTRVRDLRTNQTGYLSAYAIHLDGRVQYIVRSESESRIDGPWREAKDLEVLSPAPSANAAGGLTAEQIIALILSAPMGAYRASEVAA